VADDVVEQIDDLVQQAAEARLRGDYLAGSRLYRDAARLSTETSQRLRWMMRSAYCLWPAERFDDAVAIATDVAGEARTEMLFAHLSDALGMLVDRAMMTGQFAVATELLAEAKYVMERLPNDAGSYQVIHNMAVTYQRCGFPLPALQMYDRALRLAENEHDRTFTYANMGAAYHLAYLQEDDRSIAEQHLQNGIYAATAALDSVAGAEVMSIASGHAHRAMLACFQGNYTAALDDAEQAVEIANRLGIIEELAIALMATGVTRWRLFGDTEVLPLFDRAWEIAREAGVEEYLQSAVPVVVEILWSHGRFDEARAELEKHYRAVATELRGERSARWEHVQLGVAHRGSEALSESDPLTGLPNRRFLGRWLPDVLDTNVPVCVAVLDLDGFKQVNDEYSYAHGDRVLQELAGVLQRVCRRGDAVVRLGGDEFVLVLRDTSPNDARAVLERVRQMIAVRTWEGLPSTVTLTASVGVASGSGANDAARLLSAASEGMQMAKRQGRDRIVFR
jgi:diguanylate cyclase (GGDEF)-like protein